MKTCKFLFPILFMLIAASFFTSCEKELDVEKTETILQSRSHQNEECLEYNGNPYHRIGALHNEFLDFTEQQQLEATNDQIIDLARGWFSKKLKTEIGETTQYVEVALATSLEETFEEVQNISPYGREYLNKLHATIYKMEEPDVEQLISKIEALELSAIEDWKLVKNDRETILTTLSIARHSLSYWNQNYQNLASESNIDNYFVAKGPGWKKFWKIVLVAAVDIGAGSLGTAAGGPAVGGVAAGAASKIAAE